MTDEELIARLRDDSGNWLTDAAADRIEALVKERDDLEAAAIRAAVVAQEQRARAERLEAALRKIADDDGAGTWQGNHARAALKGNDHE